MKLFRHLAERTKYRSIEKYEALLLKQKIRLADVPEWLRMDCQHTAAIHLTAFRADREISRKQYEDDLSFLSMEIAWAKAMNDVPLQKVLEWVYGDKETELEYHMDLMSWK